MYATSGDERLPARFRGWPAEDEAITLDVIEAWSTLSAPTQEILAPFFLPPAAPGSFYHQRRPRATTDGSSRLAADCPSPCPGWDCVAGQNASVMVSRRLQCDAAARLLTRPAALCSHSGELPRSTRGPRSETRPSAIWRKRADGDALPRPRAAGERREPPESGATKLATASVRPAEKRR
jgi:hypothetical protein